MKRLSLIAAIGLAFTLPASAQSQPSAQDLLILAQGTHSGEITLSHREVQTLRQNRARRSVTSHTHFDHRGGYRHSHAHGFRSHDHRLRSRASHRSLSKRRALKSLTFKKFLKH